MNSERILEIPLSQDTIEAQKIVGVTSFLSAIKMLHPEDDVTHIEFGKPNKEGITTLKIHIGKEVSQGH